ncbi:MAG: UDP-N-acetylglucosamine 1-carboxyvinyltransferase [Ruminococcaceae bacterium]|nr:UDP-N-acetylglucosamine 1-carboxyvinyltransferase [Oscillospiraceae bacterium]
MSKLVVCGGNQLEGEIEVQGAKNAVLPILAATILNGGKNIIYNCPDLKDVTTTVEVLKKLGCHVRRHEKTLTVDSSQLNSDTIEESLMRQMRSSIIFLGAIIARCKRAVVSMPGGCEIGNRPIDLHLKALRELGVEIRENHGYIYCDAHEMTAANIHLDFPSVGATENVMLTACLVPGTTVITNAAREPEIEDLQSFLNRMGAKISGAGGDVIRIEGVEKLYGVEHTIIPDRIVAGTYLIAAAMTGGSIVLRNVCPRHMQSSINALRDMGCELYTERNRIAISPAKSLKALSMIRTMPYPGFPTDIQSPFMALCTKASGSSMFVETIFENRFQHVEELVRMGADIRIDGRVAVIRGVPGLSGAKVVAKELRGGAALVIAALAAEGVTEIDGVGFIDRGYEHIEKYLSSCGGNIKRKD